MKSRSIRELIAGSSPAGTIFQHQSRANETVYMPSTTRTESIVRRPENIVFRFDHDAYCVVCCRENSDVVQMVSNLADKAVADMYADGIRNRGGHVFAVVPAGVLVAALNLVKHAGN